MLKNYLRRKRMGRDLGIHRIDFLKDGTAVIRRSDYNLCGRTDFTGDIASLFYVFDKKEICYLIIENEEKDSKDHYSTKETRTVHVKVEDNYWDDSEFDMDYGFVSRETIQEIVDENMEKDERLYNSARARIEDARIARQRSSNLKIFEEFSAYIEELNSYIENFNKEAEDYILEILKIEREIKYKECDASDSSEDIVQSYVLLTYSE